MGALKFIPHLLSWAGIVLVLLRGFPDRRPVVAIAGTAGFAAGVSGAYLLFRTFPADISFWIIRDAVGGSLLLLWAISVAALYRSTIRDFPLAWGERLATTSLFAGASAIMTGTVAGAISASRLPGAEGTVPALLLLTLAAGALALAVLAAEKMLQLLLLYFH